METETYKKAKEILEKYDPESLKIIQVYMCHFFVISNIVSMVYVYCWHNGEISVKHLLYSILLDKKVHKMITYYYTVLTITVLEPSKLVFGGTILVVKVAIVVHNVFLIHNQRE